MPSKTRKTFLNYLLLGVFLLLAYLPVSSFLFAMKNDALIANFPNKYFFSAALRSHYLPLWNPYINFGLPLYADPGFAFWHPLTWIFGLIGYNTFTLSIETLVYIWLGGIFMFELGRHFGHDRLVSFILGITYMCCGFFIGNLQHINFLTCAAFLPLATRTFLQLQESFSGKKLFYCTISLYLLAAGGHPAIPIATIYFLAILLAGLFFIRKDDLPVIPFSKMAGTNALLILVSIGITAPLFFSWLEIFPHFNRSAPIQQQTELNLGFSFFSYLSFIFPFGTTANTSIFSDNPLMRNGYFSFIGLVFFLIALFRQKNRMQVLFLISGMAMLLLSMGGPLKELLYSHLPLLQYIRSNGEFRVFALMSFIIVGSFPLQQLLRNKEQLSLFNKILKIFACICVCIIIVVGFRYTGQQTALADAKDLPVPLSGKIKLGLDQLTFSDRLLINAVILLALLAVYFLLKKKIPLQRLLPGIIMADLVIFCWMHLPVTGVQRKSPADIEARFSSVRPGIPLPFLSPIGANTSRDKKWDLTIGCWSYYSKQPGTPELCNYPTLLNTTESYFGSSLPSLVNLRPFVFLKNTFPDSSFLSVKSFSPTETIIGSTSSYSDTLIFLQNDYPGWEVFVNNQPADLKRVYISFMAVPLAAGKNTIHFRFRDQGLPLRLLTSLLTFGILILGMNYKKKSSRVKDKRPSEGSVHQGS
ncbi:YfhO family protein [Flavitalea flava]